MLWTDAERARLRELYPHASIGQIAATLGRSKGSISGEVDRQRLARARTDRWREEEIEQVARWWPFCSAGIIARKLNRSRSAVCGKINRLRQAAVAFKHKSSRVVVRQINQQPAPRPRAPRPPRPEPRPPEMFIQCPCQLVELEAVNCHWPYGDPHQEGFFFCGALTQNGYPYCAKHHAKAHERERPHLRRRSTIDQPDRRL